MPAPPSTAVKAANAASIAASKGKSGISSPSSTPTRSSAPNAAAAAASARLNSGNAGKATPSGVGNQIGGGGGKTSTTSITRTTPNAAAANANRMAAALRSGTTLSAPGKTNMFGANQTFNKGVNLSSGDYLRAGYGQYQQPPSARPNGFGPLSGIQVATARMNPSMSSIVAGDPVSRFGDVTTNGEIGSMMGPAGEATFNRAMASMLPKAPKDQSRVPSVSSPTQTAAAGFRDYDPTSSISLGGGPTPVATAQNPARAFPARPAAPTQTASYDPLSSVQRPAARPVSVADVPQLPGGASSVMKGVTPSMGDFDMTALTREPTAYDPQGPQVATAQNPARVFPSRPTRTQVATVSPMSGQGASFYSPTGPGSAQAYNDAMVGSISDARYRQAMAQPASAQDPFDNTIYGDAPQNRNRAQRMADALAFKVRQKTAGFGRLGDKINRALGGKSQDNPDWTPPGNPNARDPNNNNSEKVRQLVAAAQAGDKGAQGTLQTIAPWFLWNQWTPGSRPGLV